ncbi:cytochrome c peroxidase [Bremerella sp. JC817]|uniref:cytochrome c peroxidase n=1 Tax=Bremerella sp. JC817 TaxID=3231756 RepID=UPI003458A6B8
MIRFAAFSATLLLASLCQAAPAQGIDPSQPALRKPEALVLSHDGQFLLTANRGTGTVSIIDRAERKLLGEWQVGQSIIELQPLPDNRYVALDGQSHEAILLSHLDGQLAILSKAKVPYSPVKADISPDGQQIVVSCLWPRKLVSLNVAGDKLVVAQELVLPFAPRVVLFVPDGQTVLVGDNFGGKLANVDPQTLEVRYIREFPAHNIRAMTLSPDGTKLLLAHQLLNSLAVTNENDIHWGLLMSNELRWVPLDMVLDPEGDFYGNGFMHPIGEPGRGGGDPTDIAVIDDLQAIVTMGGTSQVGIGKYEAFGLFRVSVEQHPTSVVVSPEKDLAYVANGFDDSISLVDVEKAETIGKISLGATRKAELVDQGEQLFHNARLSMEGWMSCHSCHTDGHTNGLSSDNLGDNSYGAPKRILSLLGKADTAPFGWLAVSDTMEAQIHKSVKNTMHGRRLSDEETSALAAYVNSLPLPPPIDQLQQTRDEAAVAHGRQIFLQNNCIKCHAPPLYTSRESYDVGMHDKEGNREFNPPSLRGIGHRDTFFHDARATSLRDVFEIHGHQLSSELTDQQLNDLLSFLRSL